MRKLKNYWLLLFLLFVLQISCENEVNQTEIDQQSGEVLAKIYCVSCHQFPNPDLLNYASWQNHILPRMGNMLGIYENEKVKSELVKSTPTLYPKSASLEKEEWAKIQAFYLKNAPKELEQPKKSIISTDLPLFKVRKPSFQLLPPSTTLVKFSKENQLLIGDAHTQSLLQLSKNGDLLNAAKIKKGAVAVEETDTHFWVTVMGSFSPNDDAKGLIVKLPKTKNEPVSVPIKNLNRPVHSTFADLNKDGLMDIVVSEFGKWQGRLNLFFQKKDGSFDQKILLNQTGAIKTVAQDFNNDGHLDLISLFGQGKEGMYLHLNDGTGNFSTEPILSFSPSNGSSYFDLFDFNQDGFLDIIYTAGDNADFPPINKPYHGVYIFKNDGQNHFSQSFFYPVNGAYKAIPCDFDLDGDFDFAVISFFPDYKNQGTEGFIYLENQGNQQFQPFTFPNNKIGRWMVMDAQDYDADGDEDLVLGSLAFEVIGNDTLVDFWQQEGVPYLILENETK